MNFSLSSALLLVTLPLASFALVGCSQDVSGSDVASASANETKGCDYTALQNELKANYDAAMAQFNAGVAQAAKDRDAVFASVQGGAGSDHDQAVLNQAILDYNAKVGSDGTLVLAYNASVAAAKDHYNTEVKACQ